MRVSMKYNSYANPCEIFSYGEVEDYAVILSGSKSGLHITGEEDEISQIEKSTELQLYPNPVHDILNLQLPEGMSAEIEVINANGQVIQSFQSSEFERMDVSELPAGLYMLKIFNGKNGMVKRFIKQ